MRKLATSPLERMSDGTRPPPGVDERDRSTLPLWLRFHAKRWLNKLIRRPATPETGILGDMAKQLRQEVERRLGHRVNAAALSAPDRVRLTRQEVSDIFSYLWMEDLLKDANNPMFDVLFSLSATVAGYGHGLCSDYTDAYSCAKEENSMPHTWFLQLDFSKASLIGSLQSLQTSRSYFAQHSFIDLSLGLDDRPQNPADEDVYWHEVATRIRNFVAAIYPPQTLLLTGESATEPCFLQAVKAALSDETLISVALGPQETASSTGMAARLLYATSMGAAEFAKRRQEGMARCNLPPECRGKKSANEGAGSPKEL